MMGRLNHDQEQLFYEFQLDEVVADDHLVREIAAVLDLSWVHSELEPLLLAARPPVDRSGTHDPDAHRRLCFRYPVLRLSIHQVVPPPIHKQWLIWNHAPERPAHRAPTSLL
jgi:hypothetical protein